MATGKSTTDHLISAAVDEDCSLMRVAFGDDPCQEYENADDKPLTEIVAYYPGDGDDWLDGTSIPEGAISGRTILTINTDADPDVTAPDFWPGEQEAETLLVEKPATGDGSGEAADALSAGLAAVKELGVAGFAPVEASFELAPLKLKSAPVAAEEFTLPVSAEGSWSKEPSPVRPITSVAPVSGDDAEMPVLPVLRPSRKAAVEHTAEVAADRAGSDHFVMIGSFREESRAMLLQDSFASEQSVPVPSPVIMSVRLKGSLWHRVAVGPFSGNEAAKMVSILEPMFGQRPWASKVSN
ncbi:SPOR domain-containing protein [Nisaea acidiphila]|uniref:SPOR domain-containing protein n=1 Tax=Nisaea acidiphila TaxID=1862145 RepID=A0A9J7AUZ0_9PROT|nr:SPOR domain-containing protein [Nisaea acidiphila]UUX50934.1 SPOR domain-containing protein [Nisaea acidiphila]